MTGLRLASMASVLGRTRAVAMPLVCTCMFWPSGEFGLEVMRSEKPLLSMFAMSKTSKPLWPLAV